MWYYQKNYYGSFVVYFNHNQGDVFENHYSTADEAAERVNFLNGGHNMAFMADLVNLLRGTLEQVSDNQVKKITFRGY